ncbi:MAG: hypothetical protein Q9160_007984 [Pyrenula sp. 1 TL-2023]
MICRKRVLSPPPNWNQPQESLDYNFVFHEEPQPLTTLTVTYLRVPEPLRARLREMVNEYGEGSLKLHAIFDVRDGIKDIAILPIRQNMGNLKWEFILSRQYPNGFIEDDADVVDDLSEGIDDLEEEEEEEEEEDLTHLDQGSTSIMQEQQEHGSPAEDLPEDGWQPLEPSNITEWHGSLADRLQQLWEDHGDDNYHGRGIQMRTHMGGSPPKVFRVEVGVERPTQNQEYPVWYHQWQFEFDHGSFTWRENESEVRVRVPSDN